MEVAESSQRVRDEERLSSVPRGGPLFVQDLVSSLTRVPAFENEVFRELESLKAELRFDYSDLDEEEDISVHELRVYTDEESVREAMKIAFEGDLEVGNSSNPTDNPCNSGVEDEPEISDLDASETISHAAKNDGNSKKRKRSVRSEAKSKNRATGKSVVTVKESEIDLTYMAKVKHLAQIRQKEEEDKTSAELHALRTLSRKKDQDAVLSSGNTATLRYLESSTCPVKKNADDDDVAERAVIIWEEGLSLGFHVCVKDGMSNISEGATPPLPIGSILTRLQAKCSLVEEHEPVQQLEVVLCVEIYDSKNSSKKTQELLVLWSQMLTELRDKIICLTDIVMQKAREHDPSGYFLIEEYFCNDMRNPSAINYSEPILDWLKNSKEEAVLKWEYILSGGRKNPKVRLGDKPMSTLPKFRSVDMQRTRFYDLAFRLGAGYLYCHQGDCKHTIVIRDMRLIHPEDIQNRAAYPLLVYQVKRVLRKCYVCDIFKATNVTLDDKLAGENPCYFCEQCYYLLHYSKDGKLLYDFTQYEYLQDYS